MELLRKRKNQKDPKDWNQKNPEYISENFQDFIAWFKHNFREMMTLKFPKMTRALVSWSSMSSWTQMTSQNLKCLPLPHFNMNHLPISIICSENMFVFLVKSVTWVAGLESIWPVHPGALEKSSVELLQLFRLFLQTAFTTTCLAEGRQMPVLGRPKM